MTIKYFAVIGSVIAVAFTGCASKSVSLNSVGPVPVNIAAYSPSGNLRVYTATETHEVGDNTYYYPHTGYSIYAASGKLWKYIPNSTAVEDESPAWVTLPAGNYTIKAQSDLYSNVTVPVVIQEGRTTVIHLDGGWKPPTGASAKQLVSLSNGEAVGWSSSDAK